MTIKESFYYIKNELLNLYESNEAIHIADWILESVTGKNKLHRLTENDSLLDIQQLSLLDKYLSELLTYKPVQYVLGEVYFAGMKLMVNESVLIPRPETEELVEWIQESSDQIKSFNNCIDIGTGSGCIAIALKKRFPNLYVQAADISSDALQTTKKNAYALNVDVECILFSILDPVTWTAIEKYDLIVSNPPYITIPEQAEMSENVLQHEPHSALFVTNNDPLQFYKAIESFAGKYLSDKGFIYLELNSKFAEETELYYIQKKWKTELRKDLYGHYRMLKCWKGQS